MAQHDMTPDESELPPPYEVTTNELNSKHGTNTNWNKNLDITCSFRGYEDGMRTHREDGKGKAPTFSLWNIFKTSLTQNALSMPAALNEPLSQLQRQALDLEYASLLNTAITFKDPITRMLYVATFAISTYASSSQTYTKSFNPLLGETYEYVSPKQNYRYVAEQVRHHPPMLAFHAESPLGWEFYGDAAVESSVRIRNIDFSPVGTCFLRLRLGDGKEELYSWRKPVVIVKMPLVSGQPTFEEYGGFSVRNWVTGEVCTFDRFKVCSRSEIYGRVVSAEGKACAELKGVWNETIMGNIFANIEEKKEKKDIRIWESNRRAEKEDQLSPFLIGLNDVPDKLRGYLPPTDSRLRPDQRALEDGQYEIADIEKKRLEELQRVKQGKRQEIGSVYTPRWFKRGKCEVTGQEYWGFDADYWRERESDPSERWNKVENVFAS